MEKPRSELAEEAHKAAVGMHTVEMLRLDIDRIVEHLKLAARARDDKHLRPCTHLESALGAAVAIQARNPRPWNR